MKNHLQQKYFPSLILSLMIAVSITLSAPSYAATVNLATVPLATATTTNVLPNLMFTLDDSGSMDSNYLPDWANDSICKGTSGSYTSACLNQPPYRSSDFNAIYYNPAIYYKPAVNADGTSKGSQTSWTAVKNDAYNIQDTGSTNLVTVYTDVEWCTDGNYTDCLRNNNYILPGTVNSKPYTTLRPSVKATGSGLVATGSPFAPTTAARSWGPHYYSIIPGEYCDSIKLTNCQTTETATFKYPAKVRWCSSSAASTAAVPAAGACQAVHTTSTYKYARYPTKFFIPAVAGSPAIPAVPETAAVAPANGTLVITDFTSSNKNDAYIMCGSTYVGATAPFNTSNASTTALRLDALYTTINGKVSAGYSVSCAKTGSPTSKLSCSISAPAGVSACSSFSTKRITASTNTGPAGGENYNPGSPYVPAVAAQDASYPGSFVRTDIVTGKTYPKATARTDCTGSTCTYDQEMTNFANWWTYYQTRMQSMKTAASLAFQPIDSRYRVGFNAISYAGATDGTRFLHIDIFDATQKTSWYSKLFASNPSSFTPLRGAISKTGQIFAHKLAGAADPMQYSCQQNFTILSTDGYWNTDLETGSYGPYGLDGASVGNKDAGPTSTTPRPMYEGPTAHSDTLADVSKYYYDTDLRDSSLSNCSGALGVDVCENNVFVSGTDNNVKQHMTTFTLGLGVNGTLLYSNDYKTAASGDFYDLKNGFGSPVVNWSDPIAKTDEERIDDLWHAAVNGQGTYFSARDPAELTQGLTDALSQINSKVGAGAAAATSTLNPVAGNNFAYVASYTTVKWAGNLEARTINLSTGEVSEAATWCVEDVVTASCPSPSSIVAQTSGGSTNYYCVTPSATSCASPSVWDGTSCKFEVPKACTGTLLGTVNSGTRSIKINGGGTLTDFTYAHLSTAQKTNFQSTFLSTNLSQWTSLDPTTQQTIAKEDNLVNYLRGEKSFEDSDSNTAVNRLFRYRESVMGDALESAPVYVGAPNFDYLETSYTGFKSTSRTATVYLGTNDGMLHAFNASNGVERWAYVPSMVIPNMWKLADKNYATMHTNYVNGTTTVSDVCTSSCASSSDWRTILVGGLNGGGKGFYALNVTGDTPSLLWEFDATSDNDMGYSFGNPVITKLQADSASAWPLGRWVVLLTSGYNNTTGSNAGKGFLYVLDAMTGEVLKKISTGVGDSTTPSGLAKIVSWVESPSKNNEATYTYGGDLLGNLWRFDINAASATGTNPFLLATLKDGSGNAQPVTTRPELGKISNNRVVFVGTGKYLEVSDLTNTQQQTIYAIKDTGTSFSNVRSVLTPQTLTTSGATRTSPYTTADYFSTGNGWYVDLPDTGERQNVSARLVSGTLVVPTTVPSNTVCSPGGYGWVNYFNYKTGGAVDSTGMVSTKANAPPVGVNIVYIDGKPVVSVTTANNPTPEVVPNAKFNANPSGFSSRRAIWRELVE